ncbi:hypothetical protein Goklo_026537 [Gossypium klotzschianum]|uniref:CCHC-type domain-containing protein n=1 Tax=Gossypium klotzschianum TaxID=34286 RepID=A0A7J8TV27_9ROSI|nr:hypothetical protein [Gossypium klotzschianum]
MDEPPDLDDLMMNEKRVRVEGFVTQPVSWKEKLIGSVPVEIIDLENDYFSVKFQTDEEYLAHTRRHVYKELTQIYWQHDRAGCKIDRNTDNTFRGQFMRLVVFIDLEKPLVSKMRIDGKVQRVEYESLQLVCFECGRFGHKSDLCPHESGEIEVSKGVSKGCNLQSRVFGSRFRILSGSLGDIDGNKSAILNGREENKEFGEEIVENGESNKRNIKAEAKIKMAISRKRAIKGKSLKKVVVEDAIMVGSDTVMVESNDETLADGDGHTCFQNFLSEYKKDFKLDLVALFEIRINGSKVDSVVTKLGFEIFFRVEVMGFYGRFLDVME